MFKIDVKEYCRVNKISKNIKYNPSYLVKNMPLFKKELKKIGVALYVIKYSKNMFEVEDWQLKHMSRLDDGNFVYFSERQLYEESMSTGILYVSHDIRQNKVESFNQLIKKIFHKRTNGLLNKSDSIKIYFNEQKSIKKDNPKNQVEIDILFDDKCINLDVNKAVKELTSLVKKYGYIDAYDATLHSCKWNVALNIDTDKMELFKKKIKCVKKLATKNIKKINIYDYSSN